jgi:uncharacterized protein (TIGR00251 family)
VTGRGWLREHRDGVEIDVIVVPKASRTEVTGVHEGRLRIRLAAPPVDGKANRELIKGMSKLLRAKKTDIDLIRGQTSRRKVLRIRELSPATVLKRLGKVVSESS